MKTARYNTFVTSPIDQVTTDTGSWDIFEIPGLEASTLLLALALAPFTLSSLRLCAFLAGPF
jgi:hypothetical protein